MKKWAKVLLVILVVIVLIVVVLASAKYIGFSSGYASGSACPGKEMSCGCFGVRTTGNLFGPKPMGGHAPYYCLGIPGDCACYQVECSAGRPKAEMDCDAEVESEMAKLLRERMK